MTDPLLTDDRQHRRHQALLAALEPDICPGTCNRAWEAAERNQHHTGEPHNLHPNPGQPIWCHDCRNTIETDLLKLPNLTNQLAHGLHTPPADTGRITRSRDTPSPSPAFDLADETCRWAVAAEITLRTHLQHPIPPRSTMRKAVAYINGHLSAMLSLDPDGIDFGTSVTTWHRRIINATGTGPARYYRIPAQCPNTKCNRRGQLRRKEGEDLVTCGACGATWDYDHWQLLVRAAVG